MSFRTSFTLLAALALSACGAPQAAQSFIKQHTFCPIAGYSDPDWSPDGLQVYYHIQLDSASDLRVMRSDGSDDHLLAQDVTTPLLSPDGAMVLFQRQSPTAPQAHDYFILDLAAMQTRRVIEIGQDAQWSPDSQWIAYATPPQSSGPLFKTNVATSETIPLTHTQAGDSYNDWLPFWSPGGDAVAFTSSRDGLHSIYLVTADGNTLTRLTGELGPACPAGTVHTGDTPAGWLPDGEALAYWRWCGGQSTLWAVDRDGVEVAEWSPITKGLILVEWSPDGTQLLMSSYDMGASEVRITRADGSAPRLLSSAAAGARWSPDGKQVVFVGVDQAGYQAVFVINADGSGLTQLTHNPGAGRVCLH